MITSASLGYCAEDGVEKGESCCEKNGDWNFHCTSIYYCLEEIIDKEEHWFHWRERNVKKSKIGKRERWAQFWTRIRAELFSKHFSWWNYILDEKSELKIFGRSNNQFLWVNDTSQEEHTEQGRWGLRTELWGRKINK